jgi:hypothetical protein
MGPNEQAFYLRTETESSVRNVVLNKNSAMDNVKNSIIVLIYDRH